MATKTPQQFMNQPIGLIRRTTNFLADFRGAPYLGSDHPGGERYNTGKLYWSRCNNLAVDKVDAAIHACCHFEIVRNRHDGLSTFTHEIL